MFNVCLHEQRVPHDGGALVVEPLPVVEHEMASVGHTATKILPDATRIMRTNQHVREATVRQ